MKDGTTHLAYKPEHAVGLDTGVIVAARIHPADQGDTQTLAATLEQAEAMLDLVGLGCRHRTMLLANSGKALRRSPNGQKFGSECASRLGLSSFEYDRRIRQQHHKTGRSIR
jgi:hypothetical protein